MKWIARFQVIKKRLFDSWMDLLVPAAITDTKFVAESGAEVVRLRALTPPEHPPLPEDAQVIFNQTARALREANFPISDNLMSLIFLVLTDLTETPTRTSNLIIVFDGKTCPGLYF